jgi:hypothetical protein
MIKSILAFAPLLFVSLTLGACAAPAGSESSSSDDSAALSTGSSSAKAAIKAAVGVFAGADAKHAKTIQASDAPAAVAPKLKSAYADMVRALTGADGFSDEKDLSKGFYAVYASPQNHAIIGYAVWAYGDNGDAGKGMIRGFDPSGVQVLKTEDSWSED